MQRIYRWSAGHRRWRHHRTRIVFAVCPHGSLPRRYSAAGRCCHVLGLYRFHVGVGSLRPDYGWARALARGAPTAAFFTSGQSSRGLSGASATGPTSEAGFCAVHLHRVDHSIF